MSLKFFTASNSTYVREILMQYAVNINQIKAVEWGLNSVQAALMAFIYDLEAWGQDVVNDNHAYKWISKQKVIDELPLFFSKPNTVQVNLIALEKKGLIIRSSTNRISLVKITDKGREWRLSGCEKNHSTGMKKITPGYEKNHTDPTTNDPSTNINKKKNKKALELDFSVLGFPDRFVDEFKQLRTACKAPITQRVINTHAKEFMETTQNGYTLDHAFDVWSNKGWKAFKYEWFLKAISPSPRQEVAPQYQAATPEQSKENTLSNLRSRLQSFESEIANREKNNEKGIHTGFINSLKKQAEEIREKIQRLQGNGQ